MREHVPLGIMRELHRWGAHAMIITVWLHMFRVFMTGSYKPPREFNWGVGVTLNRRRQINGKGERGESCREACAVQNGVESVGDRIPV